MENLKVQNSEKIQSSNKITTKDLVITGMFTALICVMAQISFPTQPIPFTLSLFAIFLTGALLTPRYSFFAVLTYLLIGAFGIPVFAGLKGGIGHLTNMTGGYLMAFPLMAFITSFFKKYNIILGMLIALLSCYLIGTAWFSFITGNTFYTSLLTCVVPFVILDLIKIALAASVSTVIRKTLPKSLLP